MTELLESIDVVVVLVQDDIETEYKLTFGGCDTYRRALFGRYQVRTFGAVADEFAPLVTLSDEQRALGEISRYGIVKGLVNPVDADLMDIILDTAIAHAIVLVSVKETQKREGDGWVAAQMPAFWYTPIDAAKEIDRDTIYALLSEVAKVTPMRVFGFLPAGDDEKKRRRLTVKSSGTLPAPS